MLTVLRMLIASKQNLTCKKSVHSQQLEVWIQLQMFHFWLRPSDKSHSSHGKSKTLYKQTYINLNLYLFCYLLVPALIDNKQVVMWIYSHVLEMNGTQTRRDQPIGPIGKMQAILEL